MIAKAFTSFRRSPNSLPRSLKFGPGSRAGLRLENIEYGCDLILRLAYRFVQRAQSHCVGLAKCSLDELLAGLITSRLRFQLAA